MKKFEVELPKGFWFQCARVENGKVVIELNEIENPQFQSLEKSEPGTWEEFCKTTPIVRGEAFICDDSEIQPCFDGAERDAFRDRNISPNQKTAEAVLALIQLIQLRNRYNHGWHPDYRAGEAFYIIGFNCNEIDTAACWDWCESPLYFKTEETRDLFLSRFRDLINKLKPLYEIAI